MDPPNKSSETLIICGHLATRTTKFNEQTRIEQVHECIRQSFHLNLPKSYQIVYYDPTTLTLVDLEDQLRDGFNPFQLNSSVGVENARSSTACLYLYVVTNSSINSNVRSSTEIPDDQIVSDDFDETLSNNDNITESNLSANSLLTNDDISQDNTIENLSTANQDRSITIISQSSNRLMFSLDVKPKQKDIYKSDEFSVRATKFKGHIARVQGVKTTEQKMLQILPRLRIPSTCFQLNVTLLVTVVSEKLINGIRIWYKNPHKGFLPEGYTKDTEAINPIRFDLDESTLTNDGDFILNLPMITKWDKTRKEGVEFYRFDEKKTVLIHPAKHDPSSPRLLCVLQRNNEIDWNTFCLSDFIRSSKPSKQRSSSVTIEDSDSPTQKRRKVND